MYYQVQGLVELLEGATTTIITQQITPKSMKLQWQAGPNYTVQQDKVTHASASGWNATAITQPLVYENNIAQWAIRVVRTKTSNIMVGIAPSTINQTQSNNYTQCGWYMYLHTGNCYAEGVSNTFYNTKIEQGCKIVVTLQKDKGEVSYTVDDKEWGVAFRNITTENLLVVSVLFCEIGDCVELVDV